MSICRIKEKFNWINCNLDSIESDPDGLCILHSCQQNKNIRKFELTLYYKLQNEDYDFQAIFFPGPVNFAGKNFIKPADFRMAVFSGKTNFIKANFCEIAKFNQAKFYDLADFNRVVFEKEVDFIEAIFSSSVYFTGATFFAETNFSAVRFEKGAHFQWTTFQGESSFEMAKIDGHIDFASVNPPQGIERRKPIFRCDFGSLEFGSQAFLYFQGLSLAYVKFSGTDLRFAKFFKVSWCRHHGRNAVYDEILLTKRKEYDLVEQLYRHLKINYEREGDYKQSGDFHYGELEMHRKASFWRRRIPLSWYNLYWALSGYGERPLRALFCLVGLLFGLTALAWGSGLEFANKGGTAGLWDCFVYTVEKASLQRPEWLRPAPGSPARLVTALGAFLIPGQAALFLLALRNRLGRRR